MKSEIDELDELRRSLVRSAAKVSDIIVDAAVRKIDSTFGKGFAQANPGLVGQYLGATAATFQNDLTNFLQMEEDEDLDVAPRGFDERN